MVGYIQPFLAATLKVLQTMTNTAARPGRPSKREPQPATGVISAVIELTGGTKGSISLTFTEAAIVGIVNNMLGEAYTEMNEDIADAVGELVNMISGEARRNLAEQGFVFHAGIPQLTEGEGHTIPHAVSGGIFFVPFKTEDGVFYIEACFESQKYFDDAQKAQKDAAVEETNASVIPVEIQSFLGAERPKFKSYFLKPNSQIMKPNFFLLPEYVGPTEGNQECNFTALEVSVCPETFFASNNVNFFFHPKNQKNPLLENQDLQNKVLPSLGEMKEKGITIPQSMYSVKRTVENAILAYNLAAHTSQMLYNYSPKAFVIEMGKIGEYALKAALLSKLERSMEREKEFLLMAHQAYRKSLPTVSGEQFFRRCFRLVAISVYLENYANAKEETAVMIKYFQANSSKIRPDEAPRIKRYIQFVEKIFNERSQLSITKHQDRNNYRFVSFD